jgi:ankyrin repeat protein
MSKNKKKYKLKQLEQTRKSQTHNNKQVDLFNKRSLPHKLSFAGQPAPQDALFWQVYADYWEAMQKIEQISPSSSASKRKSSRSTPTPHPQQMTALMMMALLLINLPRVAANLQQHPENQNLAPENKNDDIELRLRRAVSINDAPGITALMQQLREHSLKDESVNNTLMRAAARNNIAGQTQNTQTSHYKDSLETFIPKDDLSHFFNDLNLTESEKSIVTNPKIPKHSRVSRLLLIAIEKEKTQITDELIKNYDIQLNIADTIGNLLHHAVIHYPQIIPTLVKKGLDPDRMNPKDYAPLHLAASKGKVESLINLLDAKAKIDVTCRKGLTPLFLAIHGGHLEIVEILIKRGANLYVLSPDGAHPIHVAAHFGYIDIVEKLISAGVEVNLKEINGTTALHLLAYNGDLDGVRRVIALGGDIAAPDSANNTPFQYAILGGSSETVKEFLDRGVKTQFKNFNILHTAVFNPQVPPKIVKLLCDHGVPLHALTEQRDTPLMIAARKGNVANVEVLLQQELNKSNVTKDIYLLRVCAFHFAIMKKHTEVIKLFLKLDSTLRNAKDVTGKNAQALANGDQSILALLENTPTPENSQSQEQQTLSGYSNHILAGTLFVMIAAVGVLDKMGLTIAGLFKRNSYPSKNKLKTGNAPDTINTNVILLNELLSFLGEKVQVNTTKDNQCLIDFDAINFNIDEEITLQLTALDPAITEKYQGLGECITISNKLLGKYLSEILEKELDKERVTLEKIELQEKIFRNSKEYIEFTRQQQELKTASQNLTREIQRRTDELADTHKLIEELQKELDAAKGFAQDKLDDNKKKDNQISKFANVIISFVDGKTGKYQKEISSLQETHDDIAEQYRDLQPKITVANQYISKVLEFLEQLKNHKIKLLEFKNELDNARKSLEEKNNKLKRAIENDPAVPAVRIPAHVVAQPADLPVVPIVAPRPSVAPVLDGQRRRDKRTERESVPLNVSNIAEEVLKKSQLEVIIYDPKTQGRIEDALKNNKGKNKDTSNSSGNSDKKGKKPQQNRASFFGKRGEGSVPSTSRQSKVSILSPLDAAALRNRALVHAEVISDYPRFMLEYNFDDSTEKAIFYNSLTYNMTCLFVCLWEISLKTGAVSIAEEEQCKWRHFFALMADKAEIKLLTDFAIEFEVGSLVNNNNTSSEAMLQHFQNRQLNNTELYRHLEQEWFNNFKINPNNNNHEEVAPFSDVNECLDRMQILAQQFVAISNHKKTTSLGDDCLDAMKMLLAKMGENADLLRVCHTEVWNKVASLQPSRNFLKFRNAVFYEVKIDITDAELQHAKDSMPVVIELLEKVRNEMPNAAKSSSSYSMSR